MGKFGALAGRFALPITPPSLFCRLQGGAERVALGGTASPRGGRRGKRDGVPRGQGDQQGTRRVVLRPVAYSDLWALLNYRLCSAFLLFVPATDVKIFLKLKDARALRFEIFPLYQIKTNC